MNKISAVIITKDEEKNLTGCLKALSWCDEIVIVDSGSEDKTLQIARQYGCKIIKSPWLGFSKTKQLAVDSASNPWVLSLDADEVLSDPLIAYLKNLEPGDKITGYKIKRSTFYLGHKIKYSGWQGDFPLRLFNRECGAFNDKEVHESVKVSGTKEIINQEILHYSYPDIQTHYLKMIRYAELSAQMLFDKGKESSLFLAIIKCIAKFITMYIINMGVLDGRFGFILALNSSYGVFIKYIMLWQKHH